MLAALSPGPPLSHANRQTTMYAARLQELKAEKVLREAKATWATVRTRTELRPVLALMLVLMLVRCCAVCL